MKIRNIMVVTLLSFGLTNVCSADIAKCAAVAQEMAEAVDAQLAKVKTLVAKEAEGQLQPKDVERFVTQFEVAFAAEEK